SVIRVEPKLDAGPILAQRQMAIGEDENAGELADRLAALGADAVADIVNRLAAGEELPGRPQPRRGGFFARKLTKADGRIDWSLPPEGMHNRVRGLTPWPGAYCDLRTEGRSHRVSLLRTARTRGTAERQHHEPGTVIRAGKDGILVETGGGPITVTRLKPSGGRAMDAADFVRGHRMKPGDKFC
ncbi:MAG: methionyl-tRNA formyltransferase, partial [Candidatus Brocadiae bacterium]|nr:methionyl-tRNA formyltransferase [Candidatus Brocadiia bacterium]